jgi:hypothetical protein
MFTVALSIPRRGSLGALGALGALSVLDVRTDSAAGGVFTDVVWLGPEPAGPAGFTASSRFHMGNLHLSENSSLAFAG